MTHGVFGALNQRTQVNTATGDALFVGGTGDVFATVFIALTGSVHTLHSAGAFAISTTGSTVALFADSA